MRGGRERETWPGTHSRHVRCYGLVRSCEILPTPVQVERPGFAIAIM
eukprot:COSAG02_NODE_240_length_27672_cov_67.291445_27_plen_47_part_00